MATRCSSASSVPRASARPVASCCRKCAPDLSWGPPAPILLASTPAHRHCRCSGQQGNAMKLCGFEVGLDQPLFLIAGPCVIESMQLQLDTAGKLKEVTDRLGVNFIFKSSFDKANRTSGTAFRGPGMEEGLKVLAEVKKQIGVPVLTDVHEYTPMDEVASVVDVLQTPAFLVRQTDFIRKVCSAGKPVNIKKGQFLAPWDMKPVVEKAKATGNEHVPVLARAAVAVGISGLFAETHPDPSKALSDGPNAWPLDQMEALLETLMELDAVTKKHGFSRFA
eukprot:TRINITY_DN5896_c0_g1_i1.p1 TRINITY_DN5896_c0_g1~~TRINITY_DN5896_c0_g1_i1.p1  ORF type:complete len:279 (-),score=96.59 TRINITY_DN5896_c0_g1_i1:715-1551(-)